MKTFLESGLQILLLLLQKLVLVGEGVSVHNIHVVNTVCTYLPEVVDYKVLLWL